VGATKNHADSAITGATMTTESIRVSIASAPVVPDSGRHDSGGPFTPDAADSECTGRGHPARLQFRLEPTGRESREGGEQAERQRGRAGREPRLCQRPGKCIEYRQRSYEERQLKRPREHLDVSPDHVRDGKDHGPQEMV
jgi:hypothetical protein